MPGLFVPGSPQAVDGDEPQRPPQMRFYALPHGKWDRSVIDQPTVWNEVYIPLAQRKFSSKVRPVRTFGSVSVKIPLLMKGALTSKERELLERLQQVLRTEFRRVGHGSQKRVLEQLQLKKSSFDSAFSRGSVKILMLLRVLEALEVEPGRFFAQAFPADEVPPPGLPPIGVRTVLSRMEGEGDG